MPNEQANLSLQVVPLNTQDAYPIIDAAIAVIQESGLSYQVTAFNTQIEGTMPELLTLLEEVKQAVFANGGEEVLLNVQFHLKKGKDVYLHEKTQKFD